MVNFVMPKSWHELSDAQLRFVYKLIALDLSADEIALSCLLAWSNTTVIGRQPDGAFLLRRGKLLFEVLPIAIAELVCEIGWLSDLPAFPVRLSRIGKAKAVPADLQGVRFEDFIVCDNLYQGYLQTHNDEMLDDIAAVLYRRRIRLKPPERISIFYWMASLKQYFSFRFPDFFQPVAEASESNLLAAPDIGTRLQEAVDAQIRALTKGDVTKEREILALDTWRALTELNAQAREYKQLQAQIKN